MAEPDETYGESRSRHLTELLRQLAARIDSLDRQGELLGHVSELLRLMGDARSELFHYEVRSTYDSPEVAENRRIVEDASQPPDFLTSEREDDEPWHPPRTE